jgi:alkanesulfonate monooxygenase SsuD/methylene tetrahydromethanopterin reductase-like flavin-dependent oxidoreductase (luciferase family)
MPGMQCLRAPTDAEARHLFTSAQQRAAGIFAARAASCRHPIDDIETFWSPMEKAQASRMLHYSFVGSPETVKRGLQHFIANTQVDEVMVGTAIFDHAARALLRDAGGGGEGSRRRKGGRVKC